MNAKILLLILLLSAFNLIAQTPGQATPASQNQDELIRHLSAAETFQLSGDLANAGVENRAIAGIALQRIGNIAIEEGRYAEAIQLLKEALLYQENAQNRINLAIAHQRLNQIPEAKAEAAKAVGIDPDFLYGHYVLGNILFTGEDYNAALPHLEKVFQATPNFEIAEALGLTYLHLKQLERAKLLFEEVRIATAKETPQLHLSFSQAFQKTNYPLEAEREIKRALAINPKFPKANFFLGFLILEQGGSERLPDAGVYFEEELKLNPNDFYSNFFTGVVASAENDHLKAIRFIKRALELNSQKSEVYLYLAQSQIEIGDLVEAEKNLRQTIALEAREPEDSLQSRRTHFTLGRLLIRTGRREEGEQELKIASRLQSKSIQNARDEISQILGGVTKEQKSAANSIPDVKLPPERLAEFQKFRAYLSEILAQSFHNLGVIAVQSGNTDEALEKFASASRWKEDFPGLNRNWGIVSFRAGQFEKAISPLSRQLASNPNDNLVRRMLGVSYYLTKDFANAVQTLKPVEGTITADPELAYFYGISLIQLKRNQEAVPVFLKLAEVSQMNADSLFYAAQGLMMLGDYERSVKEFRRVMSINPVQDKASYFIGQSLIRLNRFDEAEKAFQRELEINPADVLSKYHLALTLVERKIETERAVKILEEAVIMKSDYADARYQLGKIFLERGETARAIEQLELAVIADGNKDYIHYQLSIAYRKVSRKEDADRALKRYQDVKAANRKTDSPMGNNENSPQ